MPNNIILASKSKVRKEILDKNNIPNQVEPSNVNEDEVIMRLPCDKHSSLDIAFNPRSIKVWSEIFIPFPIPDSNETVTPGKSIIFWIVSGWITDRWSLESGDFKATICIKN